MKEPTDMEMTTNAGVFGAMPWSSEVLFIDNKEDGADPLDMKGGHDEVLLQSVRDR